MSIRSRIHGWNNDAKMGMKKKYDHRTFLSKRSGEQSKYPSKGTSEISYNSQKNSMQLFKRIEV